MVMSRSQVWLPSQPWTLHGSMQEVQGNEDPDSGLRHRQSYRDHPKQHLQTMQEFVFCYSCLIHGYYNSDCPRKAPKWGRQGRCGEQEQLFQWHPVFLIRNGLSSGPCIPDGGCVHRKQWRYPRISKWSGSLENAILVQSD